MIRGARREVDRRQQQVGDLDSLVQVQQADPIAETGTNTTPPLELHQAVSPQAQIPSFPPLVPVMDDHAFGVLLGPGINQAFQDAYSEIV